MASTPSAPLLPGGPSDGASASGSGSSSAGSGSTPTAGTATCDTGLYADLLRRANGDQGLVNLWLAEMGFRCEPATVAAAAAAAQLRQLPPPEEEGIKAVGTHGRPAAGGAAPGPLASAWSSLTALRGSPAKTDALRSTPAAAQGAPAAPGGGGAGGGMPDADLDSRAAAAGAPKHFFCPISLQLMRDPVVVAATGQTYDRPCIERWLAQGNSSCPATGQALAAPVQLVPNVALRNSIEEWAEKHAPWLLDRHRRVKPVPKEESFGPMPSVGAATDPDLALAIRLQQEELQRIADQRSAAARGAGGAAAAGAAVGALPPRPNVVGGGPPRPPSMRRLQGSQQQQLGGPPPPLPPQGMGYDAPQPERRRGCSWTLTSVLLMATTAAWMALYVVALAKNGWNLGDLSLNPWAGADQTALLAVGAQEASLVVSGGQWWRLFSSPFVNAGVIQLLLNMSVLWTLGRHLEAALQRQLPALSIAAIFLAGSWVGALASANLNSYYVSCGASAGVCALLGATWMDQAVNSKRYVNHVWTALVLLLITAIFVVMSLLPLLDPWYQAAALLTGFFGSAVPLLAPRAARGQPGARRVLALQCLCACLVVAAATAGAVGVATKAGVGTKAAFLEDGSCLTFGRWQCLPAGASPNGCRMEAQASGAASLLRCPSGLVAQLPNGTSVTPGDTESITQICFQYCSLSGGGGGGAGGGSGGGSSGGWGTGSAAPPPSAGGANNPVLI